MKHKKTKEEQFSVILEQLIDGAMEAKIPADAVRANCYTRKYGYVTFIVKIPAPGSTGLIQRVNLTEN